MTSCRSYQVLPYPMSRSAPIGSETDADLMSLPIIGQRNLLAIDRLSIDEKLRDAMARTPWVLHLDLQNSIFRSDRRVESGPVRRNPRVDPQPAVDPLQPEDDLDSKPPEPRCRARVPAPAATPNMRLDAGDSTLAMSAART